MHGAWRWYRKDGSLMRTGRFRSGEQVGTWETWDRDGNLVKATTY
jgi:antitoxin component YwqK of YwqJK toxin-antitoxin module